MKKRPVVWVAVALTVFCAVWLARRLIMVPTPTTEQSRAYQEIVAFSAKTQNWGDFQLVFTHKLWIANSRFYIEKDVRECYNASDRQRLGSANIREARRSSKLLKQTSTQMVQREGSMLLFYSNGSLLTPTSRPGWVYSPANLDPNHAGGKIVADSRPFYPLGGGWYASKNMGFGRPGG